MKAKTQQQGYILLAVVSILTVAAALAAFATTSARLDAALARTEMDTARIRLGIEAGIARAAFLLDQPDGLVADGRVLEFQLDDLQIRVRLVADPGLIAINTVEAELLEQWISAMAPPDTDVISLVDAILDWRDPDPDTRPRGAEDRDYESQGLPIPGNRNFVHAAELRRVLGMDDAIYAALVPLVSVSSTAQTPEINFAPAVLLQMLELSPSEQDEILDARDSGLALELEPAPTPTHSDPAATGSSPSDTEVVSSDVQPPLNEAAPVVSQILHGFVEVKSDNGTARAERMRVHLDANTGQIELYGRQVIDYGSMDQWFNREFGQ
ncbi:hypothetical protein MNBD_ALPHA06-2220 [hydrothermal vent metagenome]|uniref:T2SS protein K first SAM-like domain-containing protein n=1 Tax=hydrothermal vent metagenome TaxID=652676 RepID=A0A3B0RB63_9ZZZZ